MIYFLNSNMPTAPAYGVYISQPKRYARVYNLYSEFYYVIKDY